MKKTVPVLAAALCAFLASCGNREKLENLIKKDVVKKVDLKDVITQIGEVRPVVKVELKSEASGKIDTIYVKEGERLRKGQKILKIDPTQTLTEKNKLDLSLRKAKLTFALARRDHENAVALSQTGSISQKKIEDLKNQMELADISVKEINLELGNVLYDLSKTLIVSPMEGVLISLLVEEGEIAVSATRAFSGGTSIGTVADISKLEVVTQIGEVDYPKIKAGQAVTISLESDVKARTGGQVSFVSLSAKKEENSDISNFEVRIDIDSILTGLVPGVNVNVEFIVLEKKGVPGVPFFMVERIKQNGGEAFFILRPKGAAVAGEFRADGEGPGQKRPGFSRRRSSGTRMDKRMLKKREQRKAAVKKLGLVRQRIETGQTDYKHYEVLGGLAEGDTVIKILGEERE
jgi:HlyD family secretion protein